MKKVLAVGGRFVALGGALFRTAAAILRPAAILAPALFIVPPLLAWSSVHALGRALGRFWREAPEPGFSVLPSDAR